MENALSQLYPKLDWDMASFSYLPSMFSADIIFLHIHYHISGSHWDSIVNRRHFFTNMAERMHFDPLVADNWYSIPMSVVKSFKVFAPLYQ